MEISIPRTRAGRKRKSGARINHVTVLLSDEQLAYCTTEALKRGLFKRSPNSAEPAPNRFIAALVAEQEGTPLTDVS